MKQLSELKISHTPWTHKLGNGVEWNSVWDSMNGEVLSGGYSESTNDARLIAAAPKLYRMAYEVADNLIAYLMNIPYRTIEIPHEEVAAMANDLMSALAEAAGEAVAE